MRRLLRRPSCVHRGRLTLPVALLLCAVASGEEEISAERIKELKGTVVNIEVSVEVGLHRDESGTWIGTGFVADAERGLVVTNQHVSGMSPAQFKVMFENGEYTRKVKRVYYDPWHDFAILQLDPASVESELVAAKLGNSMAVQEQDPVVLIGNNDGNNYTVLRGEVINTVEDAGDRHTGSIQVLYINAGGSSGSPVFDTRGEVIGLHYAGTDNTGYELRIEYVADALAALASSTVPARGDLGCSIMLLRIAEARNHFHLTAQAEEQVTSYRENMREMLSVFRIMPGSASDGLLEPGDLIISLDGKLVGDDLYEFDRIVNGKVGGSVAVHLLRNGAPMDIEVPVTDAEAAKVTRFVKFAGGVFHDLTPELTRQLNIHGKGVFMPQASPGSSFDFSGAEERGRMSVVTAVNGQRTPDLDAFLRAVRPLEDEANIYVTVREMDELDTTATPVPLSLNLQFSALQVFEFDPSSHVWREAR